MFTLLTNMKIIAYNKSAHGYIATRYGYLLYLLCIPLFVLAKRLPSVYKKIYMRFFRHSNDYRLVTFISLHKQVRDLRLIFIK